MESEKDDRSSEADNLTSKQIKINQLKYSRILEELEELQLFYTTITVFSREEIDAIDIKITDPSGSPMDPKPNSLYDPRMGSIMDSRSCSTCHNSACIGHDGMIAFPENKPIINPLWMSLVINILRSVCNNCGALLVSKADIHGRGLDGMDLFRKIPLIADMSKSLKCRYPNRLSNSEIKFCTRKVNTSQNVCDENPEFVNHDIKEYRILYKGPNDRKIKFDALKIYKIFSCITNEDSLLLGFTNGMRPENLIMFNMIVMPPISRPVVPSKTMNSYMPNDLTRTYEDILNAVIRLQQNIDDEDRYKYLFLKVKELMEGRKSKNKSDKQRVSISSMLQGKKSALRHTLMGKSTNRCARTVIGPDTDLRLTQVGIPMEWAKILTIQETVTNINKDFLKRLFDEGKITQIEYSKGPSRGMKHMVRKDTVFPPVGSKVFRHMMDGDVVVLNRQPTLHKYGMMAFEVVLKNQRNITFHVSVTTPYNADFDGDEMNLWAEEILGARAEAQELLFASFNAHSTAKNKPNMGLVYDAITASYLLTDEKQIPVGLYCSIRDKLTQTSYLSDLDVRLKRYHIHPLSGKGVFSMLFPPDFNYFRGNVRVVDGVMVSGRLTADHVSHSSGSIVEKLFLEYGADEFIDFLTDGSYMVLTYITETGFSVGISDCMAMDKEEFEMEESETKKLYQKIQSLVDMLPVPEPDAPEVIKNTYENTVISIIAQNDTAGFNLIKEKTIRTAIGEMMSDIGGGAKGKPFNIRQIRKMLAGQTYRNKRLAGPTCPIRATPGYDIGEADIRAAGFITSSFMKGLTPDEHFMHMMAGREGLIDTAINVSLIGDLHRKIIKALENLHVGLNQSVINNIGIVFQLAYGGDGMDPAKLIRIKPKGYSDGFASFIDPYALARDLNISKGWIPSDIDDGIKFRKQEAAKKIAKGEQQDFDEEMRRLKIGYGRGMGMDRSRIGNRGIQNRRLQRIVETEIQEIQEIQEIKEEPSKSQSEGSGRSQIVRKPLSPEKFAAPVRKFSIEEREIVKFEKQEITREAPVMVDSKYILKVKLAIKSAIFEGSYYKGKSIWTLRDSEKFEYGTFVRGLGYFLKLKDKHEGIITSGRSDSMFLAIIAFMCSLAKLEAVIVSRKTSDQWQSIRAEQYGAKIEQVTDNDKSAKDKLNSLSRKYPKYLVIDGLLNEPDYIQELIVNINAIRQKYNIRSPQNIYLKSNFDCVHKALTTCFEDSKIKNITEMVNVRTDDIVWLNI